MKRLVIFQIAAVLLVLLVTNATSGSGGDHEHCTSTSGLSLRPHSVSILEFGAVGDGVTLNTHAFQNAVFYARSFADKGGAQLYVPKGQWLTGSFSLTSHLTLFLEKDAVIIGSQDSSQWPIVEPLPSYGRGIELPGGRHGSLINGHNLTDVVITGDYGTINGQGSVWWDWFHSHTLNYSRPNLVEFESSTDIIISNLTFLNSPAWSIYPVYCSNVRIQNVTIYSSPDSPFTNGIVPDSCSNTCIQYCSISVGHDAISLKSGWDEYGISYGRTGSDIHIHEVTLQTSHGSALAFGSEMSGGISDIYVDHLHIHDSATAIQFKTAAGRGGFMKNIVISDVEMENVETAIHFTGYWDNHPDEHYDPNALPMINRITIKNIVGENISTAGILTGIKGDPFTALCFSNISLSVTSDPKASWDCSNVSGFSQSVVPKPCSDLIQLTYSNSSFQCFSLLDQNGYALAE